MAWELDHEVAVAFAPLAAAMGETAPPPPGDVAGRRAGVEGLLGVFFGAMPPVDDVTVTDHRAAAPNGHQVPLRLYVKDGAEPGPLVVHLHGGGMIWAAWRCTSRCCGS